VWPPLPSQHVSALLIALLVLTAAYGALIAALVLAGRTTDARAVARLIPDCIVLGRRLLGDPRVLLRHKLALGLLVGYLASPLDLVPDFIPLIGYLDDAALVVVVLRALVRSSGPELLREHWPGSGRALELVLRLVYSPGGWRTT
jgi:uncharacterized membrane protein YkvA (DUF1232 family)